MLSRIAGLVALQRLRIKGLSAVVLGSGSGVGGLWRTLPDWQDIQTRKEDWSINGLPIHGEMRKDILENIELWVSKYQLSGHVQTGARVSRLEQTGKEWITHLEGGNQKFASRYVVVASGIFNRPKVPQPQKVESTIEEYHSSSLRDPSVLKGKRVTVVGSGASALDCLDIAFLQGASEVHWVYRSPRWFVPTLGRKYRAAGLRELALQQISGVSPSKIDRETNNILVERYKRFGLEAILPKGSFSFARDMLIPGRPQVTKNLSLISRHIGEIRSLKNKIIETDCESFETDVLIWCTGYETDFTWTQLPQLMHLKSPKEVVKRLGSMMLSLDYPNLFLLGPAVANTNSTSPWIYSVFARTMASHIAGKCTIPNHPLQQKLNHWEILQFFSRFDHDNYRFGWRIAAVIQAFLYKTFPEKPVRTF